MNLVTSKNEEKLNNLIIYGGDNPEATELYLVFRYEVFF